MLSSFRRCECEFECEGECGYVALDLDLGVRKEDKEDEEDEEDERRDLGQEWVEPIFLLLLLFCVLFLTRRRGR